MRSIGYYRFDDLENRRNSLKLCSQASDKLPLLVNCMGSFFGLSRFLTDNAEGRLDYYLLYVVQGKLHMCFPDGERELTPGNFVIIPPQTRYRYAYPGGGEISYFWVHFTGAQVDSILKEYALSLYPALHKIEEDGSVGRKFRNLFDSFSQQDAFRDREMGILFERLLIFLARRVANGGRNTQLLAASLQLLHSSYHEDLRVPTLANAENLSVSRYNAVFRQQLGISPVEYLTRIRMSSACELLETTDLSVKEIGAMVGYADSHFFSRVFRARLGVSPKAYRNGDREGGTSG
ncbi:MAG: AraC family transcriptional regulator [Clostridia bacterium]|nr:AraC family transcriptional regulator [Clostridia bacterium]